MAQRIIDLDVALPEGIDVVINKETYSLPGDIPVPDFLEISRLTDRIEDPKTKPEEVNGLIEEIYDRVMELFRLENPDLEELPLGPQRLGALVVQLYAGAAEEDGADDRPPKRKAGTRSTSRSKTKTSRGSR